MIDEQTLQQAVARIVAVAQPGWLSGGDRVARSHHLQPDRILQFFGVGAVVADASCELGQPCISDIVRRLSV